MSGRHGFNQGQHRADAASLDHGGRLGRGILHGAVGGGCARTVAEMADVERETCGVPEPGHILRIDPRHFHGACAIGASCSPMAGDCRPDRVAGRGRHPLRHHVQHERADLRHRGRFLYAALEDACLAIHLDPLCVCDTERRALPLDRLRLLARAVSARLAKTLLLADVPSFPDYELGGMDSGDDGRTLIPYAVADSAFRACRRVLEPARAGAWPPRFLQSDIEHPK